MNARVETVPYTIGAQFAALVANGDESSLTENEIESFNLLDTSARENAPTGYAFGHWSIDTDSSDEFARCEVTGLRGQCYRFDAVYLREQQAEITKC